MMPRNTLAVAFALLLVACAGSASAQQASMDARDAGAVGDGRTDDSTATCASSLSESVF